MNRSTRGIKLGYPERGRAAAGRDRLRSRCPTSDAGRPPHSPPHSPLFLPAVRRAVTDGQSASTVGHYTAAPNHKGRHSQKPVACGQSSRDQVRHVLETDKHDSVDRWIHSKFLSQHTSNRLAYTSASTFVLVTPVSPSGAICRNMDMGSKKTSTLCSCSLSLTSATAMPSMSISPPCALILTCSPLLQRANNSGQREKRSGEGNENRREIEKQKRPTCSCQHNPPSSCPSGASGRRPWAGRRRPRAPPRRRWASCA